MRVKTNELTGDALDWAVAKCEGKENTWGRSKLKPYELYKGHAYSTDWAQGGEIIERERISIVCVQGEYDATKAGTVEAFRTYWIAEIGRKTPDTLYGPQGDCYGESFILDVPGTPGKTPLVAAMRCYVASKLGDEVEIPEELQ